MQVADVAARAHQVLGLLDEAAPGGALHLDGALLTPPAGGGGDDQVRGRALEDLGQEDVQGLTHAVEHLHLLVPLAQGGGGLQAGEVADGPHLLGEGGQELLGQAGQAGQGVGDLVNVRDVQAPPGRGGEPGTEDPQGVGTVQQPDGPVQVLGAYAAHVLGGDPGGGAGPGAAAGELGELLEGVVGGHAPRVTLTVEGLDVAAQASAHGHQALALEANGLGVQVGDLHPQGGADRLGGVTAPVGVLGEVGDHASQPGLAQDLGHGVPVGVGGGHVQHGAPGGGGVGQDGGQGVGDVGAGGRVEQEGGARADGLDGVELGGVEVADTPLGAGGAVGAHRLGQRHVQGGTSLLVTGQGGHQGGGAGALLHGVEVLYQGLPGVDEGPHDQALVDVEGRQVLTSQRTDTGQGRAGGEALPGQGGPGDGLHVLRGAVAAQGAHEDGVDLDGGLQGDGGLRVGAGQAHGPQQDGGVDGPGGAYGGGAFQRGQSGLLVLGVLVIVLGVVLVLGTGDGLVPRGHANGQVDGGDAELPGQALGAGGDLAQALAGHAQGGVLTDEVGQVGGSARVELGQAGGVGRGEIHDAVDDGNVVQAGDAPQVHQLAAPRGQGRVHAGQAHGIPQGGHDGRRRGRDAVGRRDLGGGRLTRLDGDVWALRVGGPGDGWLVDGCAIRRAAPKAAEEGEQGRHAT